MHSTGEHDPRKDARSHRVLTWIVTAVGVPVIIGLGLLLVEYVVLPMFLPKEEAENWTTKNSPTDLVGVHSTGVIRISKDDRRIHLTGQVWDTNADGKGARLVIAIDDRAGRHTTLRYDNTLGAQHPMPTEIDLSTGGRSLSMDTKRIAVTECLTDWADPAIKQNPREVRCGTAPLILWEDGEIAVPH